MSNNTVSQSCPNPDCENLEFIDVEIDSDIVHCKDCGTPLQTVNWEEYEENEDDMDDEEPDFEDIIEEDIPFDPDTD